MLCFLGKDSLHQLLRGTLKALPVEPGSAVPARRAVFLLIQSDHGCVYSLELPLPLAAHPVRARCCLSVPAVPGGCGKRRCGGGVRGLQLPRPWQARIGPADGLVSPASLPAPRDHVFLGFFPTSV